MKRSIHLGGVLLFGLSLTFISSCTKLKDESYSTIISNKLQPTEDDLASLLGTAYSNWRFALLDWDGLWRTQELSACLSGSHSCQTAPSPGSNTALSAMPTKRSSRSRVSRLIPIQT